MRTSWSLRHHSSGKCEVLGISGRWGGAYRFMPSLEAAQREIGRLDRLDAKLTGLGK